MKTFEIFGDIVDKEIEKQAFEDVCPQDFKRFVDEVEEGEDVFININSCGGSVSAGVSIANMIRRLSKKCKTTSNVQGVAASIASAIACACDELRMGSSSFLMIHPVWGYVSGNSEELRKEADVMEKMTNSLLSFYHLKFDLTDEELMEYIKAETWISGADAANFKLNAVVEDSEEHYKYAAKLRDKFNNLPNSIRKNLNMEVKPDIEETEKTESAELSAVPCEQTEEKKAVGEFFDEPKEEKVEQTEEKKTEEPEEVTEATEVKEEKLEEPTVEELKEKIAELEKKIAELEAEKETPVEERVAKCQSTFQNKINHFKDELKAKDEELQKFKDSVSSLSTELENTKKELHSMSAAFKEKDNALQMLNASVLTPSEELPAFKDGLKNCKSLKERIEFIKSGKYHN